MTPTEIRAAARLAARTLAGTAGHVEQVHHAVAARAFLLTKPVGTPVQLIHDAVANGVYAWVRAAELAAGTVAGEGLALAAGRRSAAPAGSTHASNLALAFLNAAIGHRLAEEGSPLAIRMAVRMGGRDVRPDRAALAAAFPAATTRLAVFLHGLGETDEAWRLGTGRDDPRLCYGTRLADDFGYTPVYLRYNTGLHISENGRQLAGLLAAVVANWPATVEEIVLIGHSMGGLVARSGCHDGQQAGAAWVPAVRHVVYLGSPHLGASLEKGTARLSGALARLAETRPLATLVNGRSVGIKDLRHGYLVDDDWRDCDPDTCLVDHRSDVPLLETANHYVVAATVTRDPGHPVGRIVGDLLVQPSSAHGRHPRGRHIPFWIEGRRHVGGLHHFDLLNHPAVYEAMRVWLDPSPGANGRRGAAAPSTPTKAPAR
jgi:hypothetical protein